MMFWSETCSLCLFRFKTIRAFRDDADMKSICNIAEQIRSELEAFKPNLPLIIALRNPGMRDRQGRPPAAHCKRARVQPGGKSA